MCVSMCVCERERESQRRCLHNAVYGGMDCDLLQRMASIDPLGSLCLCSEVQRLQVTLLQITQYQNKLNFSNLECSLCWLNLAHHCFVCVCVCVSDCKCVCLCVRESFLLFCRSLVLSGALV